MSYQLRRSSQQPCDMLAQKIVYDQLSDYIYSHQIIILTLIEPFNPNLNLSAHSIYLASKFPTSTFTNGLFDTKLFMEYISTAGKGLTFWGVNAQYQNGKDKNQKNYLTTGARESLLHTVNRFPKFLDASLWPVTLKNYTDL